MPHISILDKTPILKAFSTPYDWYDQSGTYTLSTAEELLAFNQLCNDGQDDYFKDSTIKLGADIIVNGTENGTEAKDWAQGNNLPTSWTPIAQFNGTFDGQGHTISGIYINSTSGNTGLFDTVNKGATVASTVTKISSAAGMDMLVTGDMVSMSETILCENFSKETLKADILQQPHHNRTDISTVYEYVDAQVMLFTQTVGALTSNTTDTARSTLAKQWCSEWYCGGTETVGFNYSGNKANLILQRQDIYN